MTTAAPAPTPASAPAPTEAPAASAAAAPTPTAASPAPAAPTPPESLFTPSAPSPAPAPAATGHDWLPEKFRVMGSDGALDLQASSQKLAESYAQAQQRIGAGDVRPATAADYSYTPPEEFKDVQLDETLSASFRERAHAAGLTNAQYQMVMGEYFQLVPSLLDAKAAHTTETARQALQQVWPEQATFEREMSHAQRGFANLPPTLQTQINEAGLGANPQVAQLLARLGAMAAEDRPPSGGAQGGPTDAAALMASEAYNNPKHPDHAKVSAQVQAAYKRQHGDSPVY